MLPDDGCLVILKDKKLEEKATHSNLTPNFYKILGIAWRACAYVPFDSLLRNETQNDFLKYPLEHMFLIYHLDCQVVL